MNFFGPDFLKSYEPTPPARSPTPSPAMTPTRSQATPTAMTPARSQAIQLSEQALIDKIRSTPNFKLYDYEYNQLPSRITQMFEWQQRTEGHGPGSEIVYIKKNSREEDEQITLDNYNRLLAQ